MRHLLPAALFVPRSRERLRLGHELADILFDTALAPLLCFAGRLLLVQAGSFGPTLPVTVSSFPSRAPDKTCL